MDKPIVEHSTNIPGLENNNEEITLRNENVDVLLTNVVQGDDIDIKEKLEEVSFEEGDNQSKITEVQTHESSVLELGDKIEEPFIVKDIQINEDSITKEFTNTENTNSKLENTSIIEIDSNEENTECKSENVSLTEDKPEIIIESIPITSIESNIDTRNSKIDNISLTEKNSFVENTEDNIKINLSITETDKTQEKSITETDKPQEESITEADKEEIILTKNHENQDCKTGSEENLNEPVHYVNSGSPMDADGNKNNNDDNDVLHDHTEDEDPIKNSNDVEMTDNKQQNEDEKATEPDPEPESEPMIVDTDDISNQTKDKTSTSDNLFDSIRTEKTTSDNLFDSVRNTETEKNSEIDNLANIDDSMGESENKDTESDHHNDNIENDTESVAEDCVDDDLERGKGADEEMCLLPEREISEADKERAIAAAADSETTEKSKDDDVTLNETSKTTEQTEESPEANENDENDIITEINDETTISLHDIDNNDIILATPKDNEIKEILTNELTIEKCFKCNEEKLCEFTFNENNEVKYICTIECVNLLREDNPETFTLTLKKTSIVLVLDTQQKCIKCIEEKLCKYRMKNKENNYEYICDLPCLNDYLSLQADRFVIKRKRYLIDELQEPTATEYTCIHCSETKICKYSFKQEDDELFVCHEDCLNLLLKEQPDRIRVKRRSVRVRDLPRRIGSGSATIDDEKESEQVKIIARTEAEAQLASKNREMSFTRRCVQCNKVIQLSDKTLYWETFDFCDEKCLGMYQNVIGANCTTCNNAVTMTSLGKYCVRFGYEIKQFCRSGCLDEFKKGLKVCSYCQRDISSGHEGFLASVGDKGQFKDFCAPACMKKYDEMCNQKKISTIATCAVCSNEEPVKVEVILDTREHKFCSNPCFSAFKFVNNVYPDQCGMCQKYFERCLLSNFTIYQDKSRQMFCSKICMNLYIITNRKIVPCNWCKVKKYNFDMIKKLDGVQAMMMCSLNCLTLSEVSMNAISMRQLKCDQCKNSTTPQYHLTMSDATIRNFCTYQCVMSFQGQFSKAPLVLSGELSSQVVPTGLPKRVPKSYHNKMSLKTQNQLTKTLKQTQTHNIPVISNVTSLANSANVGGTRNLRKIKTTGQIQPIPIHDLKVNLERVNIDLIQATLNSKRSSSSSTTITRKSRTSSPSTRPQSPPSTSMELSLPSPSPPPLVLPPPPPPITKIEYKTQIVTIPPEPKKLSNISTMCKPIMISKGTTSRPTTCSVECQTDDSLERKIIIPIPVPIYIPQPMYMYSLPTPIPVPFPLPIPIPIFIPTTRNSAQGIMKELKKIQDKMPTDPFEAELLMMAEMVAGDKKRNDSDSGSDIEANVEDDYATETIENSNAFGEDMLQIALKMASEYEPAVDLESAMPSNTITPSQEINDDPTAMHHHHMLMLEQQQQQQQQQRQLPTRGRKRTTPVQTRNNTRNSLTPVTPVVPNKRSRRSDNIPIPQIMEPTPEPPREPAEKADANMCLKFTFGVNAWKQWVMTKNSDLEKSSIRRKPFKSDLLQLTADELNYSLCLFVKEVRKPNGTDYAPDTIYYLVLGIQQYLYEHSRIDNIFTDPYYEKFTDCLDEVAKKFSVLYNDSQYIVTRVEEEHLWECKQLGAHSPHVLLSTLMFFNTKHFNLTTVEEHMQLSFSHIMKHWKRNPNQPGAAKAAGSRNVLLRFYPPQSSLDGNSRKKKVYEQQENEENPLRCPVKLYEFYLSKCPESVKTRNDVFYLQPERSCVPDSPVWYSTQALSRDALSKMLHRVKMVKEINIALLTS